MKRLANLSLIYARREPTTDSATRDMIRNNPAYANPKQQMDVVFYTDKEAKHRVARTPWHYSNCPTRRNKYQILNCYRYQLVWLDPLPLKDVATVVTESQR